MFEMKSQTWSPKPGFPVIPPEVTEAERQSAWALYTEMCSRRAVTGLFRDPACEDFTGEIFHESLSSLRGFFEEVRAIMREYPAGAKEAYRVNHLGVYMNDLIVNVLRPFLEKWDGEFTEWWIHAELEFPQLAPRERQRLYPHYQAWLADWSALRKTLRHVMRELVEHNHLMDPSSVDSVFPLIHREAADAERTPVTSDIC